MKKQAWLILCMIALVAGLALAATNQVTAGPIEEQRIQATQAARAAVFPDASSFEEMPMDTDTGLDSVYLAKTGEDTLGYVLQITVSGYGGPIEIIMGVDTQGTITGLTVGGSDFAETAGLGTQVKEPAFTDQFVGLSEMPTINGNVDTISGATISSSAVINGVIQCYRAWKTLTGENETAASADPLYADGIFVGNGSGFIGPVKVAVTVNGGVITKIQVLEFIDTDALFAMAREAIVPSVINTNGTDGVDTVTGATYSSQGILQAIENALCSTCAEQADNMETPQYTDGVYTGEAQGFSGKIKVSVTVSEGAITAVKVLEQNDTDEIFAMARNGILPAIVQLNGPRDVDTVTGATYSSQGLLDAVDQALSGNAISQTADDAASGERRDGVFIGEAQGFLSEIKVSVTIMDGAVSAIRILNQDDTDSIFARAQEGILPAVIAANGTNGVDTVSGATYSSQGLLDAIANALCAECAELLETADNTAYSDGIYNGSAQGYMGEMTVSVTIADGMITDIDVIGYNDSEAIFAVAKDAVIPAVINANSVNGIDTVSGATYSSQGLLDAIQNALSQPIPPEYHYADGIYEGEGQGYDGIILVSITILDSAIAAIDVLETGDHPTMFTLVEDTVIPNVIAHNTADTIDAMSDATYSSQGLLDAISDALQKAMIE